MHHRDPIRYEDLAPRPLRRMTQDENSPVVRPWLVVITFLLSILVLVWINVHV